MAKEIRWSKRAGLTFENVVRYLENEWSAKEVKKIMEATNRTIRYISDNPSMFRETNKKGIHEALVTPHNLLIYKVYTDKIILLVFWDTRRNPRKKSV